MGKQVTALKAPVGITAAALRADLRHMRSAGADAAAGTAPADDEEGEARRGGGPEHPHEEGAGLQLSAPALVVVASEGDPGGAVAVDVGAVRGAQLGGQHDAVGEGEHGGGAVEEEHGHGQGDLLDDGEAEAVQHREPGPGDDEHGEVHRGHGRGGGVDIPRDDVADQTREDDNPDELNHPEDKVEDLHGGIFAGKMPLNFK